MRKAPRTHKILSLLLCGGLLAGCKPFEPTPADLAGTYQAPSGSCTLKLSLRVEMSYTYERLCAGSPAFSNFSGWQLGTKDGATAVALHDFKLGLGPAPDAEPGVLWLVKVERPWFGLGQPRLCMDLDHSYCFTR